MHAASTEYSISAPVLSCCSRVIAARSSACALGDQVHHLPAGHARRARRARPARAPARRGRTGPRGSSGSARISNASACRLSPARIAVGLVEGLVDGRLAAPQIVVVHARQIVVDQRIDVDRLDRRADPQRARPVDREQSRGGARSAAAAAACRRRSRHGASPRNSRSRRSPRRREQLGEKGVDLGATRGRLRRRARRRLRSIDLNRHRTASMPAGLPSGPSAICSIRACAAFSRASQWRFSRSPRWYSSIDWSSGASPCSSVRTISSSRASASSKLSSSVGIGSVHGDSFGPRGPA